MSETLIQCIGFIALCFNIFAASTTHDNRARALICLSCLTLSIHFTLLGSIVTGLNLFVNSFRALVSVKYKGVIVFWTFVIIQLGLSIYFYSTPLDLLPTIASLISCYALFCAHGIHMRIAFFICTSLWMLNAIIIGSYGGFINDIFNLTMLSITIYRLNKVNEKVSN